MTSERVRNYRQNQIYCCECNEVWLYLLAICWRACSPLLSVDDVLNFHVTAVDIVIVICLGIISSSIGMTIVHADFSYPTSKCRTLSTSCHLWSNHQLPNLTTRQQARAVRNRKQFRGLLLSVHFRPTLCVCLATSIARLTDAATMYTIRCGALHINRLFASYLLVMLTVNSLHDTNSLSLNAVLDSTEAMHLRSFSNVELLFINRWWY